MTWTCWIGSRSSAHGRPVRARRAPDQGERRHQGDRPRPCSRSSSFRSRHLRAHGSRRIGHVMQCPPPHPLPSSKPRSRRPRHPPPASSRSCTCCARRRRPRLARGRRRCCRRSTARAPAAYWSPPVRRHCASRPHRVGHGAGVSSSSRSRGTPPRSCPVRRSRRPILWTTFGYAVALSRSSSVNTVSRCMCARSLVITQAMTRSAAPLANISCAISSIIRPCERSLIPMSTAPLPIGIARHHPRATPARSRRC